MNSLFNKIKAIELEDKIICGKCKHKISDKIGKINKTGECTLMILCKWKDRENDWKECNTVNLIEL
jgi:hypothetical protein